MNNYWLKGYFLIVFVCFNEFFCVDSLSLLKQACTKYTHSTLFGHIYGFNDVSPKPVNCPLGCDLYLKSYSALGYDGPLGSLGPLGGTGPLSSSTLWTPANLFGWSGNFNLFLNNLLGNKTVLNDPKNPLSAYGPLGDSFWDVMPDINDFTKHMQGMGLWTVIGPLGPLGPLGGLGPLGPVGAHGYAVNVNGEYINANGEVKRTVNAVYNDSLTIEWPLFERYSSKQFVDNLSQHGLLDTSFMVLSTANTDGEEYTMVVSEPQYITITVTPVAWGKNFFMQVYLDDVLVLHTEMMLYTPWAQIYVSESDLRNRLTPLRMKIVVKTDATDCGLFGILGCEMQYYLYVVGSTQFMLRRPHIEYTGPYIKDCNR